MIHCASTVCNGHRSVSVLIPIEAGKTYIATMFVEKVRLRRSPLISWTSSKQKSRNWITGQISRSQRRNSDQRIFEYRKLIFEYVYKRYKQVA